MGTSIASLLVAGVMLAVVMMMNRSSIAGSSLIVSAAKEAVELAGDRARTRIQIRSTSASSTEITVNATNIGATSVTDFSMTDFIVEYIESPNGTPTVRWLTYSTSTPLSSNEWKVTSISPDEFQPNLWNPREVVTVDAKLDPAPLTNSTGTVILSTPNGVSASGYFAK